MGACSALVAHNGEAFDLPFIRHEFGSLAVKPSEIPLVDTLFSLWATEGSRCSTPAELAFSFGFTGNQEHIHGALYDTDLMMQCFFKAREKYGFFKLPSDISWRHFFFASSSFNCL
ncbi:exonuclease domain-containing protein [Escherichia coli]|uniref:exonuclease domain-containing protein n=1 Tax=Escherichia coli TaxID=562 RepID=UPI0039874B8E